MTTDNNQPRPIDDRSEFVRLMLDNDMQSSLSEVESAEKVKDYRHRSNSIATDDLLDTDSLLNASNTRKRIGFSPLTKIITGIIAGVIVISLLATLGM